MPDEVRKEAMEHLGFEEPVDFVTTVPLDKVAYLLDLPGSVSVFTNTMNAAVGCRFVTYTKKGVFGLAGAVSPDGIVSVPRHPEK